MNESMVLLNIKLPKSMHQRYKEFCRRKKSTMAKEIRKYIMRSVEVNVLDLLADDTPFSYIDLSEEITNENMDMEENNGC